MKRKLAFLLIIALLVLSSINTVAFAGTVQLPKENIPYYADSLKQMKLLVGSTDGLLHLEDYVTRGQAAVMLVKLLGKEEEAVKQQYPHPFVDVPDWASPYVGYCYQNGITAGTSKTTYSSFRNMTKEEYAAFVLRTLGYADFVDFTLPTAINKMAEIGLISINEIPSFNNFTRDRMALMSFRALFANLKGESETLLEKLLNEGAISKETVEELGLLEDIKCKVDGKTFKDIIPPAKFGRTLFNISDMFSMAGWQVNGSGNTITLSKGNDKITLKAGDTSFEFKKVKYNLGFPVTYTSGKLYAPFELFNHVLGAKEIYVESQLTYEIMIQGESVSYFPPSPDWFFNRPDESDITVINNETELFNLIVYNIKKLNNKPFYFKPSNTYSGFSKETMIRAIQKAKKLVAQGLSHTYGYSSYSDGYYSINFVLLFPKAEARYISIEEENNINTVVKQLAKPGMSDLDIIKAFHDYIIKNARYDEINYYRETISNISYTPYGVLILKIGVCESYARAFKIMLDKAGIDSMLISGYEHMWNIVKVGNKYRHFDLTWDDPIPDKENRVLYDYFGLTDAQIKKDHIWDEDPVYPVCN